MSRTTEYDRPAASRRDFLKTSGVLLGGALAELTAAGGVHAAGGDTLRVGLIGCGSRGTGAAEQALKADKNVKLVAMADAFADRLESSLALLQKVEALAGKVDVRPDHRFVGFDAYKQLLASGVDVVLLTTTPHFRPIHLRAAVEAGKHIFAEKPVAVDAPGIRSALESCALAEKKGLSVVSGLCLRYHNGFRELVQRVHDGAVGEVRALLANDYRGTIWVHPRKPEWTDMQYQMRNWYYFTWLSGDFNVEQHVHFLDVCAWAMKDVYPVKAMGLGGRQVRTGPEFGNIYDHFSVVYEYANGARLISNCRQQNVGEGDMSAHVLGSHGEGQFAERRKGVCIKGDHPWFFGGPENDIYQTEHNELFASIRAGKPINNGVYMAKSSLLAIMGRMACYTGKPITWEMALNSKEDLSPPRYDWNVKLPDPPVAMPGKTLFI